MGWQYADQGLPLWHTHVPALAAAAAATSGPVLELGAGHGSTPLLHGICAAWNRELWTYETNPEWLQKFMQLATPWHRLVLVSEGEISSLSMSGKEWGLVFVDHIRNERRKENALAAAALSSEPAVVLHDFQPACFHGCYRWQPVFDAFRYRWIYRRFCPHTAVLCQHPLPGLDRLCSDWHENCPGTGCSDLETCRGYWSVFPECDRSIFHKGE